MNATTPLRKLMIRHHRILSSCPTAVDLVATLVGVALVGAQAVYFRSHYGFVWQRSVLPFRQACTPVISSVAG